MIHLPKKTYSRRNKTNKKLANKRNTEAQPENRDFDVDQTLPEDIWKDSFDRLKDLDSVPTPRNRNSDRGLKRLSVECGRSIRSFVSTPKAASRELEECPIPFSPIETRRYFLSNDYYDSRGNPRRIFEYSSEIGQELLQSLGTSVGTDLSRQNNKTKSENFLNQGSKTKEKSRVKPTKLRDKTNLISSNRNKCKQVRAGLRLKSVSRSTGKENPKMNPEATPTYKRGKSEVSNLRSLIECEQISSRDQKHTVEAISNLAECSSLAKEPTESRNQNTFDVDTSRKSKQKRKTKKRQKPESGSLDNLTKQSVKETTDTLTKRSKQTITPKVDLAADFISSEPLVKHSSENKISINSASTRKSKQNRRRAVSDSVEKLSKLSNRNATCNKVHTKRSGELISLETDLDTAVEVLEREQLSLPNINIRNSEAGKIWKAETINNDCLEIPSSQNMSFKNSQFDLIPNVQLIVDDDSVISSSQKTPLKTRKPKKSDPFSAKKARAQRQSRKANRYLPLPFVEIISGKKLEQETIVVLDETTKNIRKSRKEKRNSKKSHYAELSDQTKQEEKSFSNCKGSEISLHKTSFHEDLNKGTKTATSEGDRSSNESLAVGTRLHENSQDRMSFVTRRTKDRQSRRERKSDPALSISGKIVDVETENCCLDREKDNVHLPSLRNCDTETDSKSFQPKTNKVKWGTSPTLDEETAKSANSLTNVSLNSSIDMEEFLNAVNRTTTLAVRSKRHLTAQKEEPPAPKLPIILQPGKWRKSLNMWRRLNTTYKDKNNDSQIVPAQNSRFSNQSLMRTFCDEPFNSSPAKATDQRPSTRLGNNSSIYRRKTIFDYEKSTLTLKEGEDIFDVKKTIPEDECDTSITCSESALLLEPTDDESPNLSTLPHLTSVSKQNVCTSLRRSQTVCYKELCLPGDSEYSNETSNERAQRYQHQLSVPLPLYRQPSISRRRRTSIVGLPVPGIGGPIFEDDLFTEFVRLSTYEVSLRAQLDAKDIVLRRCGQSEPLNFADEYSEKALHQCRKIGEGVYGEVFMNKNFTGETVVLKIIPIEGCIEINGESQKRFDEILSEIVIAMELSRLRNDKEYTTSGFVEVKKVRCVKGRYPDHLLELWELFRENHGTENDHPEIFPEDQLYIVLELANGGQDLEAFTFQNALQSYSALVQVALTIAAAERKFQFEHRDLHWGNILLAPTEEKELSFRVAGKEINIPTHGVKATIIDYTLSRMVFDGCCLYNDLSNDNELFSAGGDYQFDIYRFMRKRLEDQWERFEPYTNVLWLHYAIDKMISGARYRCSKSKKHRAAIHDMMQLRDEMLDFKSASDYIECLN